MTGTTPQTSQRRSGARIVAMMNQKGGVGKTTSTVNLGAALAEAGARVCLIDLDPQAHLTFHLGITPDQIAKTVYDLFVDPECSATDAIVNARPNLDVILSEVDLAAAESELAAVPNRQSILRQKFGELANNYDAVIIDCPPSLGLLTLNALSLAREVFVPMQAHFLALQGVGKLLETVGLVCTSINPELRVTGIILCMHESQTTLAKEIVADLDDFFEQAREQDVPWRDCRVLRPAIRRNVKLAEAPSFGKTILDYEPWCPGAHDYRMLATAVLAGWGNPPLSGQPAPMRGGVMSVSASMVEAKRTIAALELSDSLAAKPIA
ncbi:MAG: AAA family ATPase [Phycisphaerales bacterium]|nr:AAA family ATPase [Phycisphaerales bacterium]